MARDLLSELAIAKLQNLRRQLEILRSRSPFYAEMLSAVDPETVTSLDDLASLPYTTARDVKDAGPFGLLLTGASPEAYCESSGTTGEPTAGFPDLSAEKAASFGRFLDHWMGLRDARVSRALVGLAYEMNPTGYRLQSALPHAGVTVIPCGVRSTICPPETVLALMRRLAPQAVFSRPFEILRMADALRQRGEDPAETSVTKIFMLGEPISMQKWRRIADDWDGADLYAHYGLTEIDAGLHTCEAGFYHEPLSPDVHFDLIDGSGRPLKDAGTGEIVASVLKTAHAPLLNYRTGDLAVRWPGRCSCQTPTPRYSIIGRASDGLLLDGKLVFPIEVENAVFELADVGNEYVFAIEDEDRLRLILERSWNSTIPLAALADDVEAHVRDVLGITVRVEMQVFGGVADKLGIAKKKGARFTDLRGLDAGARARELRTNVVDSADLRAGHGAALSI